jgi:AraC-like DNA-binding protein
MTFTPLLEYIANQLQTPVSLFDFQEHPISQYPADPAEQLSLFHTQAAASLLEREASDYPVFTFINNEICLIHFAVTDGTIIIGPFRMLFTENITHAKHTLVWDNDKPLTGQYIPGVYPPHALRLALLLFNCCHSSALTEVYCWEQNFDSNSFSDAVSRSSTADIFSNRENQKMHNPYTQEIRLLKSIEDGDVEVLQKIWKEPLPGTLGTTSKDPVRNGKNLAIYNITVCGRAAVRAGLPAEYIFSLTDSYSQQVEELKNMLLLQSLVESAELHFAQLVAELKSKKKQDTKQEQEHPMVRRCKDYIFKHLHEPLTVTDIAHELHVHPNYLNLLFHKQEGIPLYQYILHEKINLTKNLLTYSDYSYLEIAHYLGFLSQSHLGTRFKAITGMTLKQYRDEYQNDSFFL